MMFVFDLSDLIFVALVVFCLALLGIAKVQNAIKARRRQRS